MSVRISAGGVGKLNGSFLLPERNRALDSRRQARVRDFVCIKAEPKGEQSGRTGKGRGCITRDRS